MTATMVVATTTGTWHGGPDRDRLVAATHAVLDNCGFAAGASRVRRLVQRYERNAQGYDFGGFIANSMAASSHQRAVLADELRRVVGYSDPTGEAAVNNITRGR